MYQSDTYFHGHQFMLDHLIVFVKKLRELIIAAMQLDQTLHFRALGKPRDKSLLLLFLLIDIVLRCACNSKKLERCFTNEFGTNLDNVLTISECFFFGLFII